MVLGFILVILLQIPTIETYSAFHFWQILPALQDQSKAFYGATVRMQEGLWSRWPFVVAQTICAPLTMVVVPYLALVWFETRRYAFPLLIVLAAAVSTSIMVGRDFQLFLAAILVACSWVIARVRRRVGFSWKDAAILGGGSVLLMLLFGLRKWERMSGQAFCAPGVASCEVTHGKVSLWDSITVTLASYASQGLEGLGHAFNATWAFGGGYSHSPAVAAIFNSVFGARQSPVVTLQLDGLGWSSTGYWSTGFAAIANDVPWVLIPLVLAAQGGLLALSWRAALKEGDWLSTAVFAYTFFTLLFMPLTLQLATSGPLYVGYVVLIVMFVIRSALRYCRGKQAAAQEQSNMNGTDTDVGSTVETR